MPTRVFTEEEKSQIKLIMLEAGFPLLKKYGMTHTTISKITEAAGIAKDYPSECRKTREDVDIKISCAINEWKKSEAV